MLTQEQKDLMDEMLISDAEITHDQTQLDNISGLDTDNMEYFNVTVPESGQWKQIISAKIKNVSVFVYNIYTSQLIRGVEASNIIDSQAKLDAREQTEITDKLQTLKSTIV